MAEERELLVDARGMPLCRVELLGAFASEACGGSSAPVGAGGVEKLVKEESKETVIRKNLVFNTS